MPLLQFLRNTTGVGSQGQRGTFTRYRGAAQTHQDLTALLANRNVAHLSPATAAGALAAGNWRLTVIIQLYHDAKTLAVAGQGGHVSLFLWDLAGAQSLSFHMAMGRGANGHPVLGGSLYPFEPRLIYQLAKGNCVDYYAVVALGARAHLSPTATGQDVWFYTRNVTNAQAETMRQRMVHHLANVNNYRFDPVLGIRQRNYYTCLTLADDILHSAGCSRGLTSSGTPWSYSYAFVSWDCSLAADQTMLHLLPFQQTDAGDGRPRGIRQFIGLPRFVLHWDDITHHPAAITETWDLQERKPLYTHNPPMDMRYDY